MLNHPTLEHLHRLRLKGMAQALEDQSQLPEIDQLSFDERFGLLVDREVTERSHQRMVMRLKKARLRQTACVEDIDYRTPRGLDKALITRLADGQWIEERLNLILTGPTGTGKTWLACALAHQACRQGHSVLYLRMPRLFGDLAVAKEDGRYAKLLAALARTQLLILDDWGLEPLGDPQRRDLLEILEDRYGVRSTLVTSQLPVEQWHEWIGEPTLADAILDRLVHNAHRIALKGESMRKKKARLTNKAEKE